MQDLGEASCQHHLGLLRKSEDEELRNLHIFDDSAALIAAKLGGYTSEIPFKFCQENLN